MKRQRIINPTFAVIWGTVAVLFVVVPLVSVALTSVSAAQFISFPWEQGFSLRWYAEIPNHPGFLEATWNSLLVAVGVAVISTIVGTLAAIAITRERFPGRGAISLLGSAPLFVPEVLTGLAIAIALSSLQIKSGYWILIIGHVVITLPFVLRVVSASLAGANHNLEWAAEIFGANKLQAFRYATLPQIAEGVVGGTILAVVVSFDNAAISLFLQSPGFQILPVYLFNTAQNDFNGIAAAYSVCMIVATVAVVLFLQRLIGLERLFGRS